LILASKNLPQRREDAKVFYKKWWIGMVAIAVRMRREKEDIFKHAWESRSFEPVHSGVPVSTMPVNPDPV
jgi:hypothetical protein